MKYQIKGINNNEILILDHVPVLLTERFPLREN